MHHNALPYPLRCTVMHGHIYAELSRRQVRDRSLVDGDDEQLAAQLLDLPVFPSTLVLMEVLRKLIKTVASYQIHFQEWLPHDCERAIARGARHMKSQSRRAAGDLMEQRRAAMATFSAELSRLESTRPGDSRNLLRGVCIDINIVVLWIIYDVGYMMSDI